MYFTKTLSILILLVVLNLLSKINSTEIITEEVIVLNETSSINTTAIIATVSNKAYGSGTILSQCTQNYCNSRGYCELQNSKPTCLCQKGYVGSRCQVVDPCNNMPCGANGACFPVLTNQNTANYLDEKFTRHCQCYSGFTGNNCEHAPPKPCTSSPCLNHGICVNKNNSMDYYCICIGTYTGKDCATYIDQCANNKCKNEALCIPSSTGNNYTCSCKNGFYGTFCEKEYNECQITSNGVIKSPCLNNATCYDLVDAYYCECKGPWIGKNCETSLLGKGNDLRTYLLPAAASAALLPIIPAAILLFKNKNKSPQDLNPCNSQPCPGGSQCSSNGSGYSCQCKPGFFGPQCKPNPCISNPCKQQGSICVPVESNVITAITQCVIPDLLSTYLCVCNSSGSTFAGLLC